MRETHVQLEVNELTEHAVLVTPETTDGRGVLFAHGYKTNGNGYVEFARACAETGTTGLVVDLLSHGQSGGEREDLSIATYLTGLTTAYDHLAAQPGVNDARIGMVGGSFGAYLTVLLSAERPLQSMLLRVPALYPDNLRNVRRGDFDTQAVLKSEPDPENSALQMVHNFIGKVLLVSSGRDEVIMPSTTAAYAKALNKQSVHIPMYEATHQLDTPHRQMFKRIVAQWAAEL